MGTKNPRDFTTTNLKDSTITISLNKVSTMGNLRDFTTMLDFTMTKKTRTVSTTTVSTMTDFTTTTIPSKKMVSTTKMVFTMMVRMLSPKRKRAKRPSLSLESQDVNNFVYAT